MKPFDGLTPDVVVDAALSAGLDADGRLFALNSYENRVYQLWTAEGSALVLKFYRPERWSDAQIIEEHTFTRELAEAELPVAAPVERDGRTLQRFHDFRFAAFPWLRGRAPEMDAPGARALLGRSLARLHQIGARNTFRHRAALTLERFGWHARTQVLNSELLPEALRERYASVSATLLERTERAFEETGPVGQLRIHGDCHLGNLLWNDRGPAFVDLDDCMRGPRIQDLWMMLSGSPAEQQSQWAELLEGYQQFADFDFRELMLIEPLRSLRILHHAGWIAHRWQDPAFPRAFPWVGEPRYWERHLEDLLAQIPAIDEPPLLQA